MRIEPAELGSNQRDLKSIFLSGIEQRVQRHFGIDANYCHYIFSKFKAVGIT